MIIFKRKLQSVAPALLHKIDIDCGQTLDFLNFRVEFDGNVFELTLHRSIQRSHLFNFGLQFISCLQQPQVGLFSIQLRLCLFVQDV